MLRCIVDSKILPPRPQPQQPTYVPLKQVKVETNIRSFAADVTINQIFRNEETTPIEAVYCFPIEEQAAVYSFKARIDDREIVADLKEKKEAQKEYAEALQQGHGAYLLEQDEKSQDNFIINVGALPAGKECHITISYVTELQLVQNGRKIRFVVPTTIAPRYNPDKGGISGPAGTTAKYIQSSPYTIEFLCRVDKTNVKGTSSLSHPIQIDLSHEDAYVITFAQNNTHLDRDILVDIDLVDHHSNTILAVETGAAMVALTPTDEDCRRVMNQAETTNEFIFVVDCSGSMQDENKIGLARQAMLLFLKSLPVDSHFNIIRFGSSHQTLFNTVTAVYNEANANQAEKLTKTMSADLGGTELLHPLEWLQQHPPAQGRARQIFLLTDGEISNVDQVLDLCRSMASSARIFSFGLGHSPSRSLVKGLARATNGRFVFIPPNSSVDSHVGEQLEKALQPCITNVKIKWNVPHAVLSAPRETPPVYVNDRLIFYGLAEEATAVFDHNASVELYTDQHQISEAKITRIPHVTQDGTIARLAAKALILELQHSKLPSKPTVGSVQSRFKDLTQPDPNAIADEKERIKKRIIELSLKYKILSPHTAFVGVERRAHGDNAGMVLREVPIEISADDKHLIVGVNQVQFSNARSAMNFTRRAPSYSVPQQMQTTRPSPMLYMDSRDRSRIETSLSKAREANRSAECDANVMLRSFSPNFDMLQSCTSSIASFSSIKRKESASTIPAVDEDKLPTGDEDIVRHLIAKQKFDGLWDLTDKEVETLTGKQLDRFPQGYNQQILISAIIVVLLEIRFSSFSSMWHGVVQKARKRLMKSVGDDMKKLEDLLDGIRSALST